MDYGMHLILRVIEGKFMRLSWHWSWDNRFCVEVLGGLVDVPKF
jgi:hypothetical protein